MNRPLEKYIAELDPKSVSDSRRKILDQLVQYINQSDHPKLNFICSHNSRRSHLSQIWAQTMAHYFGVKVETFSGGTEATAFHPNAVAAIEKVGFEVKKGEGENPHYEVRFSNGALSMTCYSKTFDDRVNPSSGFAAIMTCSEADSECPIVFGADTRIKLFYEDPKVSDGSGNEEKVYGERCRQIATEMMFVFQQIKT